MRRGMKGPTQTWKQCGRQVLLHVYAYDSVSRFTVRDGSAHIHVPSRWSNADGSGGMSLTLELVPGSESVTVN